MRVMCLVQVPAPVQTTIVALFTCVPTSSADNPTAPERLSCSVTDAVFVSSRCVREQSGVDAEPDGPGAQSGEWSERNATPPLRKRRCL